MSRSRRKTPISGITTARSEKRDKRYANRAYRRAMKCAMARDGETLPALRDEVSTPWSMDKDGKRPFDVERFPELMRK